MSFTKHMLPLIACTLLVAGCGSKDKEAKPVAGAKYLLSAEPKDAQDVGAVVLDGKDKEQVTLVGRIGGEVEPFVDGEAAFKLVDRSLQACSDIEGDSCPTPWDYCCETPKLKMNSLLVQVVDDKGQPVETGAKELLGVKELQTVVVKGELHRDKDKVVVMAKSIYVKK